MRIGSIIIFHLSELWKAKFFILCDVIFLMRLQGEFEIDLLGLKGLSPSSWEPLRQASHRNMDTKFNDFSITSKIALLWTITSNGCQEKLIPMLPPKQPLDNKRTDEDKFYHLPDKSSGEQAGEQCRVGGYFFLGTWHHFPLSVAHQTLM